MHFGVHQDRDRKMPLTLQNPHLLDHAREVCDRLFVEGRRLGRARHIGVRPIKRPLEVYPAAPRAQNCSELKNAAQPRFATLAPPLNDGESKTLFQAKEHWARCRDGARCVLPAAAAAPQPRTKITRRRRHGAGRLPIGSLFWLFPIQHFRRLMIRRLSVPVLLECEPDKSERHKDGSGQHHPMRIFHP